MRCSVGESILEEMLPATSKLRSPSAAARNSAKFPQYLRRIINWARDGPAFVVITGLLLMVATAANCAEYDHSSGHAVFLIILVFTFHFLLAGIILATFYWLYAFDVHWNSFFPMFVLLYVIQYLSSPLLVAHGFFPVLSLNLLFMAAASYYQCLKFLGYDVLPFLEMTTLFLYRIGIVIVLSPIFMSSGFNPWRYFMNMYLSHWHR